MCSVHGPLSASIINMLICAKRTRNCQKMQSSQQMLPFLIPSSHGEYVFTVHKHLEAIKDLFACLERKRRDVSQFPETIIFSGEGHLPIQ